MKIYQYTAPRARGDDTRWIAANTEGEANAAARSRGWRRCGGEIFAAKHDLPQTAEALVDFGCDVVVN